MLVKSQFPRCFALLCRSACALHPVEQSYATNADAVADSYFQLGGNFFAFCRANKRGH